MAGVASVLAIGAASQAHATTVTLGPPSLATGTLGAYCDKDAFYACDSSSVMHETVPGGRATAPSAGRIIGWRIRGTGQGLHLLVLRATGKTSEFTSVAFTPAAEHLAGQPNAVSLPVQAGDFIGVSLLPIDANGVSIESRDVPDARYLNFKPGFTAADQTRTTTQPSGASLQFNADLLLAPVVSSLSPAAGPAAGGTSVIIAGQYLDGATAVMFGSTPASSFTVDSPAQITAVAPAGSAGSTVDVTVSGPGGTSSPSGAARYAYDAPPPADPPPGDPPPEQNPGPGDPPSPGADITAPTLTALVLSPSAFTAANIGGSVASAKVGTNVYYKLSEAATTTFTVARKRPGIRRGKRCVKPTRRARARRKSRRCTRWKPVRGNFDDAGAAGLNQLKFTGRIGGRALRPGAYRLQGVARDAAGNVSKPARHPFRIVK